MFHVQHFHPIVALRALGLLAPAGERNDLSPGRVRGPGAGPIHNRLGDVAQQQPAILLSLRRSILAKGRDGGDLLAAHSELRAHPRCVQGEFFQMRKRNLISAQMVAEARGWAEELTALEIRGPGDLEPAWRRLEARYAIPYSTFWSLKYRHDLKDIWASLHRMLELALTAERALRAAQDSHHNFIEKVVTGNG
ncbi:hypothetical protein [Bradyrhizobium sp. BRP22]|uniref:hypothetical protein n=1 Tax=Bradyrhizobium sp. BRP22 TaxID=2793821 RepID=UPI001CD5ED0D|nr:hypothetical protein [Bradyrhizobium sp. BRP22]